LGSIYSKIKICQENVVSVLSTILDEQSEMVTWDGWPLLWIKVLPNGVDQLEAEFRFRSRDLQDEKISKTYLNWHELKFQAIYLSFLSVRRSL